MSVIHRGGFCCSAEPSAHPHLSSPFFSCLHLSPSLTFCGAEMGSVKRRVEREQQPPLHRLAGCCMLKSDTYREWELKRGRELREQVEWLRFASSVTKVCSNISPNWQPTRKFALSNCPGGPGSPFFPIGPIGPTGPGSPTRPLSPWTPLSPEIPGSPCSRYLLLLILATYTVTVYASLNMRTVSRRVLLWSIKLKASFSILYLQ